MVKNHLQCRRHRRCGFDPWVKKIPWRRKWQSTPVFLPGEPHGQRRLAGYSPKGHKKSDVTEHTHTRIISKTWHLSPLEFSLYYANNYFQAKVFFFFFRNTRLPISTLNFKRLFLKSHCFSSLHLAMALYTALEEYLVSVGHRQSYLESDHISLSTST